MRKFLFCTRLMREDRSLMACTVGAECSLCCAFGIAGLEKIDYCLRRRIGIGVTGTRLG